MPNAIQSTPQNKKFLILGHGGHGKSSLAKVLQNSFLISSVESSRFMTGCIRSELEAIGVHYDSDDECYHDRRNHREFWFDVISRYNKAQGYDWLARQILAEHDCYIGMRNKLELEASIDLFDYVLWITAGDRVPQEPSTSFSIDPSMIPAEKLIIIPNLKEHVGNYRYFHLLDELVLRMAEAGILFGA